MAYTPPSIGPSGLSTPSFNDILSYLNGQFLIIFGAASYLGPDSSDGQDISVRALAAEQCCQGLQAVYLSLNPLTAIGTSLDLCGQIIGTARKAASFSTVTVTLTGTAGTVITNGVARDTNGNQWNLPSSVTIGLGGTVTALATAQVIGNVTANAGAIQIIATPTAGWTAITNSGAATPGNAIEPDSQYRTRLLVAQAKPSLTLLAGTAAAVAAVASVTRSVVYENPAGTTSSYGFCNTSSSGDAVTITIGYPVDSSDVGVAININGSVFSIATVPGSASLTLTTSPGNHTGLPYFINGTGNWLGPPHSITTVVEGGASADIAQAIYDNRGIGPFTNGTTTVSVTDPSNPAITMPISFDILGYVPIYAGMTVHALAGFTSATQAAIAASVVAYLNGLGIGQTVVFSELYGAALAAQANPFQPSFSIRSIISGAEAAQTTAVLNSTTTITVTSATGIANGQTVVGNGIPANTTVSSVTSLTVVISNSATITASGVLVTFFPTGTTDINVPYNDSAQGESSFVVVTLV